MSTLRVRLRSKWQFLFLTLLFFSLFNYASIRRMVLTNLAAVSLNHGYGRFHSSFANAQLAQNFLEEASSLSPENQSVTRLLGLTYLLQGDPLQAQKLWSQSDINLSELLLIAENGRVRQKSEFALSLYETVLALDPLIRDSYFYKAEILLEQNETALAKMTLAQGLINAQTGNIGESDLYLSLGEIAALENDKVGLETAVSHYHDAIQLNDFEEPERNIRAHYLLAEIFRRSNQTEDALLEYQWILAQKPNHYWANVRLAQFVWDENNDSQQAEALLLRAINATPQEIGAYRVLGGIYEENGRFAEAAAMYQQILAIDPTDTKALAAFEAMKQKP